MNKRHLMFFIGSTLFFLIIPNIVEARLVPCGPPPLPPCEICHLFVLVWRIVGFILYTIAPPLAALFLVFAGFKYYQAAVENPDEAKKVKDVIISVFIGLIILYGSLGFLTAFTEHIGDIPIYTHIREIIAECPTYRPVVADNDVPTLTGITLSPASATVVVGQRETFRATAYPEGARMGRARFHVVDTRVGTIDDAGVFTAIRAGETSIGAAYRDFTAWAEVEVIVEPLPVLTAIHINPQNISIRINAVQVFTATAHPEGARMGEVTFFIEREEYEEIGAIEPDILGRPNTTIFRAIGTGTTNICARYGDIRRCTGVMVVPARVVEPTILYCEAPRYKWLTGTNTTFDSRREQCRKLCGKMRGGLQGRYVYPHMTNRIKATLGRRRTCYEYTFTNWIAPPVWRNDRRHAWQCECF